MLTCVYMLNSGSYELKYYHIVFEYFCGTNKPRVFDNLRFLTCRNYNRISRKRGCGPVRPGAFRPCSLGPLPGSLGPLPGSFRP